MRFFIALAFAALVATTNLVFAEPRLSLVTYVSSAKRMLSRELTADTAEPHFALRTTDPRTLTLMKKKAHSICRLTQCYALLDDKHHHARFKPNPNRRGLAHIELILPDGNDRDIKRRTLSNADSGEDAHWKNRRGLADAERVMHEVERTLAHPSLIRTGDGSIKNIDNVNYIFAIDDSIVSPKRKKKCESDAAADGVFCVLVFPTPQNEVFIKQFGFKDNAGPNRRNLYVKIRDRKPVHLLHF